MTDRTELQAGIAAAQQARADEVLSLPRLKGREVSIEVFIDGQPSGFKPGSIDVDVQTEVVESWDLEDNKVNFDSVFKGCRIELTGQVEGTGFREFIERVVATAKVDQPAFDVVTGIAMATLSRTHTGAWLVKGGGPTRRYRTRELARKAAVRRAFPLRFQVSWPFDIKNNGATFEMHMEAAIV